MWNFLFMRKTEAITIEMITIKREHKEKSGRRHGHAMPVGAPGKPPGQARPFSVDDHISPTETHACTNFGQRAEELAEHLKLSNSVCNSMKGKLSLGAEIVKKGGVENLFRQLFAINDPEEKLLKTFVCYLSTTTDPVAGVIFISTQRFAFCSERPLVFTSPSRAYVWSYYRVNISIQDLQSLSSHENVEKHSEKYIKIETVVLGEIWFMGFVNFHKAIKYMQQLVETCHHSIAIECI